MMIGWFDGDRMVSARWRLSVVFAAAATAGVLASGGVASAASFTVTTTNDSYDGSCTVSLCSLRDAIVAADRAGGASTITVPAGTYKLTIPSQGADDPTTGDLDVDNGASVTVSGAGSGATVIDANNVDRAFAVQQNAGLTLSGLTVENGNPSGSSSGYQAGGAIYSDGALAITGDVVFQDNSSPNGGYGGAIFTASDAGSTLDVSGATFRDNSAYYYGGAIYAAQPGTATIQDSTFTDNNANVTEYGGAIYGDYGAMTVDASSFTGNDAGNGGAIYWDVNTDLTVTNSSFTGNNASYDEGGAIVDWDSAAMTLDSDRFVANVAYYGGALYLDATSSTAYTFDGDEFDDNNAAYTGGAIDWELGTLSASGSSFIDNNGYYYGGALYAFNGGALSLVNATIAGNSARWGGGIYYQTITPTSLTNDTIAYNTAISGDGGGIYDPGDATTGPGATGVLNTIVADNHGGDCGVDPTVSATSQFPGAVDAGHNLDSDSSCFAGDAASDKVGVDPLLAGPADNGGAVLTDRLEAGSPAIDAGDSSGCPATDARGIPRPQGAGCDIGSYEAAPAALSLTNSAPAGAGANVPFSDTITVSDSGPAAATATTVTDQLPAGETLYGATPSQGSCTSTGSPATVTCNLGTIDAGASATVTLLLAEANAGPVTNTATATDDEGANTSAAATTSVAAPPTTTITTTTTTTTTTATPTPVSAPKATTGRSSHLTEHGAMLSGKVTTGGQPTVYFFQYGSSRRLGNTTGLLRATRSRSVKAHIAHLLAGHRYYYRLAAVNSMGIARGRMHTFHTKKAKQHHKH